MNLDNFLEEKLAYQKLLIVLDYLMMKILINLQNFHTYIFPLMKMRVFLI